MSGRILAEAALFGKSFLWGMGLTFLYEGWHLLRRLVRHGSFAVAVEDLLYWLTYAFLLFRMFYLENDGIIRGFALLAVLLGMMGYLQFRKLLIFIIKSCKKRGKELK